MCTIKKNDSSERRRQLLYVTLLEQGDQWTSMRRVYDLMSGVYPCFEFEYGEFHDSTARRMISADIQAINESHFYPKMIIQGNRGVKIATKAEIERYIKCQFKSAFNKVARIRALVKKANLDGQFQLCEGQTVEAFMKEETA